MDESQPGKPRIRIQLIDAAAMVVGYGLAAVLFRAFWPRGSVSPALGLFALGFYVWLGLAMSGPLILLRRQHARDGGPNGRQQARSANPSARTWAEMAWLLIGVYWIVMGVLVLPIRLHSFRASDSILFGLVPLAAGLVLRFFVPKTGSQGPDHASWSHQIAVSLLVTWPIAWVCLIVVAQAML
jgi:hypothetical protein